MPSRSNWIESHTDLRHHPKLQPTAAALGVSSAQLCGHLHFIWHWCLDYQEDGDVTRYSDKILADAAGWEGDCNAFVTALRNGGWLDSGKRTRVHNWELYAGKLLKLRAAGRTRAARFREKHESNGVRNGLTVPNPTVPNQEDIFSPGNGHGKTEHPPAAAKSKPRARFTPPTLEEIQNFAAERNLTVDPIDFHLNYTKNGWKVGRVQMVNWKAAMLQWERKKEQGQFA